MKIFSAVLLWFSLGFGSERQLRNVLFSVSVTTINLWQVVTKQVFLINDALNKQTMTFIFCQSASSDGLCGFGDSAIITRLSILAVILKCSEGNVGSDLGLCCLFTLLFNPGGILKAFPSYHMKDSFHPGRCRYTFTVGGFHTVTKNSFLPAIIYQFKILKKKNVMIYTCSTGLHHFFVHSFEINRLSST